MPADLCTVAEATDAWQHSEVQERRRTGGSPLLAGRMQQSPQGRHARDAVPDRRRAHCRRTRAGGAAPSSLTSPSTPSPLSSGVPVPLSRRRFLSVLVVAGTAGSASACGGGGQDTSGAGSGAEGTSAPVTAVTIVSTESLFDVTKVTVPVGVPVTFTYDNRDTGVPHNLHVSGNGLDTLTPVKPGDIVQTLIVTFPRAGAYDYVCDVHPVSMQGVITAL